MLKQPSVCHIRVWVFILDGSFSALIHNQLICKISQSGSQLDLKIDAMENGKHAEQMFLGATQQSYVMRSKSLERFAL